MPLWRGWRLVYAIAARTHVFQQAPGPWAPAMRGSYTVATAIASSTTGFVGLSPDYILLDCNHLLIRCKDWVEVARERIRCTQVVGHLDFDGSESLCFECWFRGKG